jgi:molybdopterin synthase catalytic subunit
MIKVDMTEEELRVEKFLDTTAPDCGAEALFIGKVRDHQGARAVIAIEYDAFVPLVLAEFSRIAAEAREQWGDRLRVRVVHRKGRLVVGEIGIFIRVESPHRAEAFGACRFIIEEIKKRAPIWKKEFYDDGESEWVQGHALCQHGSHGDHSCGREVVSHGNG